MHKLLCTVITPISGSRYLMRIPNVLVSDLIGYIVTLIEREGQWRFAPVSTLALFDASTGAEFSRNSMIGDYGLVDGSEIYLV